MKYCSNCGKELTDSAAFCSECGAPQQAVPHESAAPQQPTYQQAPQQQYQAPQQPYQSHQAPVVDSGSFGWAVLGFFFPVVGLILFLVWKDQKPLTSKKAGIGALVGVISSVVFYVIFYIMIIAAGVMMY